MSELIKLLHLFSLRKCIIKAVMVVFENHVNYNVIACQDKSFAKLKVGAIY